ncbi:hypothetical protein P168DRAFT_334957 [Aspergillus campestris IBT 28561]|uniref:Transcription factor IIIC subunit delta N-term-domain-containing protein n=1 Tax=Aspergillus campestris (strain IBT 28561) TaxID=1392248 RepID=A0A2I1CTR4_ASPC2|nr:uncharacterized protein P168DRAFT_334957 [Aspergillus campestris IBT 28561]PKY01022.1 hypothetical protein P168DRAFT_334957 [Aspergillus campestris IBT 28561]
MPNPAAVELQLSPSCYNCLSWSADGELAMAAGEYVQILTPQLATQEGKEGSSLPGKANTWHVTRIRVNLFANKEWPTIFPQKNEHFSIGPEQSLSTVVGLSWSPPGLARYRRCALAVLTSNLLLSLYEAGAKGKWKRVAIVNAALKPEFQSFVKDAGLCLRKTYIRSFAWAPPLKVSRDPEGAAYSVPGPEARWGVQVLAVTNDDNDLMCLQVRRSKGEGGGEDGYSVKMLGLSSLHDAEASDELIQSGSLFSAALRSRVRALHTAFGPWVYRPLDGGDGEGAVCSATANIAVLYGSKVKVFKLDVTLAGDEKSDPEWGYSSSAVSTENALLYGEQVNACQYTGPLRWIHSDESRCMHLAAGAMAKVVTLSFPREAYAGTATSGDVQVREWPLADEGTGEHSESRSWEPISGMITTFDESTKLSTLHIGTVGGLSAMTEFGDAPDEEPLHSPLWKNQLDDVRERFDLDCDLGGLAIARVWGLASHRGLAAAAITLHPGDMVDYRTTSGERTSIVFSPASLHSPNNELSISGQTPIDLSPEFLQAKRETVLGSILFSFDNDTNTFPWSQSLLYAAACCTAVGSRNQDLLSQAKHTLEWLAAAAEVDLTDEISTCSTPGGKIKARSTEQLDESDNTMFEVCTICDAGIGWHSPQEAQCASGHLFVRCGLTFKAIQEPGLSKFCSLCGAEYLSEDMLDEGSEFAGECRRLATVFDTCVYCQGKFLA